MGTFEALDIVNHDIGDVTMPAHMNRSATFIEEPSLLEEKLPELLALTNAKVEYFDISPDGRRLAYVSAKQGGYDLYICSIDGTEARRLVAMYPEECIYPKWSFDGEWLAYFARGEAFKVRVDGSEAPINLTYGNGPGRGHEQVHWTPDGKHLVFARPGPNGFMQIAKIPTDIPDGKIKIQYLTDDTFNSTDVDVSPNGLWVAFMSDRSGYADFKRMDVYVTSINGGEDRNVTPNTYEYYDYRPRWSPDSRKLVFTSDRTGWRNIGIIDVRTSQTRMLTESKFDEYNPRWSPDGRWIAYVANCGWNFQLMKIQANGSSESTQITNRAGVHGGIDAYQARGTIRWTPDSKRIVYTFMNHDKISDLWVIPTAGGTETQITDHMPEGLKGFSFVEPKLISYRSKDGLEIPAWLYRPNNAGNSTTPLVIYARANTKGFHVKGFYPYIQYWAYKGYSVVAPQVRGSGGLGKRYEFLNYGDWGGGDIDDFAYAAFTLAEKGIIDEKNVFMQGGSTGGFFTFSMCHRYPDLLKAAVAFYGSTDLIHSYRMKSGSSMPVHGDVVAGDRGGPDMAPEHWRGRSIFYNLDKVKTPLQVQWGDRDGVRISMADDLFREAKKQGLYMEYIQYNCESHGWYHWRPETVADSMRRMEAHWRKFMGS